MKRLIIDIDGTLTHISSGTPYSDVKPRLEIVEKIREYQKQGFAIVLHTSRNMKTYKNSVGAIVAFTVPVIIEWLQKHDIPYDELHVGKPWCGHDGFYVDDKAIRPSEFKRMSYEEIDCLLEKEAKLSIEEAQAY
jgi:capsule biosynthesis phosphatase